MRTLIVVTLKRGEMSFAGYRERHPTLAEAGWQMEKLHKWKPGEEAPPDIDLGFDKAFIQGRIQVREYDQGAAELFQQFFLSLPGMLSSPILHTQLMVVNKLGTDEPFTNEFYTKVKKNAWLVDLTKLYAEKFEEEVAQSRRFTDYWLNQRPSEPNEEGPREH